MNISIISHIDQIDAAQWNLLAGEYNPFVRHEFLAALEHNKCVGEEFGWLPQHIVIHANNQLIGAVPLYLKDNSYGEFVFDWGWADAYHRAGINYYPKLVVTTPYTPVTGPRLLTTQQDNAEITNLLIKTMIDLAERQNVSSLHCLFTSNQDTESLEKQGFMRRTGYQFHWTNHNYHNFDDFLAQFTAIKRKKIKRERRHVSDAHIKFKVLRGADITEAQWAIFHQFYRSTFDRLGGYATLSLDFFLEIGQTMPAQVLLILAEHGSQTIAGAFGMIGKESLYGRHWGCTEKYNNLHFEACYYQGIDFCIQNQLKSFEPGAQGEHKISRGFLPTRTYSAHWIQEPRFKEAINEFLHHETRGIEMHIKELNEHSPYKETNTSELVD